MTRVPAYRDCPKCECGGPLVGTDACVMCASCGEARGGLTAEERAQIARADAAWERKERREEAAAKRKARDEEQRRLYEAARRKP